MTGIFEPESVNTGPSRHQTSARHVENLLEPEAANPEPSRNIMCCSKSLQHAVYSHVITPTAALDLDPETRAAARGTSGIDPQRTGCALKHGFHRGGSRVLSGLRQLKPRLW